MPTVLNPHFVASQGGYSRDRATGVYTRMGSTSAVCTNDWELARYIQATLLTGDIVTLVRGTMTVVRDVR